MSKDQADLDAEEMFGVDCNHTGQSFICEHCVAAELREKEDEIERLNKRFPCGHRIVDWDDSYGECVVCKIKQQADAYDNLPHTVFECHDKIEELQDEIELWKRLYDAD